MNGQLSNFIYESCRVLALFSLMWLSLFSLATEHSEVEQSSEAMLPGEMKIGLSTFHELRSEFKHEEQRLEVRSNMSGAYDVAVRFSIDDMDLHASFDLVKESMVLDGNGAILKPEHKKMFSYARRHLMQHIQKEFENEYPEHSFLAVQMLGYWSRAPKGYPIGRREIDAHQ